MNNRENFFHNSEGYKDPTAYLAIKNICMEAEEARRLKRGGRRMKHKSWNHYEKADRLLNVKY